MATSTAQRVGIWVIAVAMIVGTVAGFAAMIFASDNQQRTQDAYREYQKQYAEYQKNVEKQTADLSKKYYKVFSKYKESPAKFSPKGVKVLTKKDLKVGSGKVVKKDTKLAMYYIGWNPKGKVFDSSLSGKALKRPLIREGNGEWIFDGGTQGSVIEGWEKGIQGMKLGGVRLLTIPSSLAYKEGGQGDDIPPNTPLKFIVMAVKSPDKISEPEITQDVLAGYNGQQ